MTIIWRIHDHKQGHGNQTLGLVRALSTLVEVQCIDIPVAPQWQNLLWWLTGTYPIADRLPVPDLILGAGHDTHIAVLAARRAYGGKAVVLMKPSLPLRLFDLCVVPEHDALSAARNLVQTRGVLNVVEPTDTHEANRGLMMVGGPSSSYGWDNVSIVDQVAHAATGQPQMQWTLTTSRRTPEEFLPELQKQRIPNLTIVPCDATGPRWVPKQLSCSAQVWVSEDSVSMVYEALTSGAAVGLFEIPGTKAGRVSRGVQQLIESGWVTPFSNWKAHSALPLPPSTLYESRRCAEIICERYQLSRAA